MVRKRTGEVVLFDINRIVKAIHKAFLSCKIDDLSLVKEIAHKVKEDIDNLNLEVVSVEQIQDLVEKKLMEYKLYDVAKSYILYRKERERLRKKRLEILEGRETKYKDFLSLESLKLFKSKYLHRKEDGTLELPEELFERVATLLAQVEEKYGKGKDEIEGFAKQFFEIMDNFEFLPSGRILANLGFSNSLVSCTAISVTQENFFKVLELSKKISKLRLGVGYNLNKIPPADMQNNPGPVGHIFILDEVNNVFSLTQPGFAAMAILGIEHPDVLELIHIKSQHSIDSFGISISLSDKFLEEVDSNSKESWKPKFENKEYSLRRVERDSKGKVTNIFENDLTPKEILMEIAYAIWNNGEPGLVFLDNVNKEPPLIDKNLEVCDSCGEQYLYDLEGCILGSINLSKFVKEDKIIDWERLEKVVKLAVRMLDNAIDLNHTGIAELDENLKKNRRIGLGVMGFADMLIQLNISYNSKKAIEIAKEVMKFISEKAREASYKLALEKGTFPNWNKSIWKKKSIPQRNLTLTSISPTGSLAILANTSFSIEPLFSLVVEKVNPYTNERTFIVNPHLEKILHAYGVYDDFTLAKIAKENSLQDIEEIPESVKRIFVTTLEVNPKQHILIQAAFQEFVDNAISKTCNLPSDIKIKDIFNLILFAWKQGVKGITFYRAKSREDEVIDLKDTKTVSQSSTTKISPYVRAKYESKAEKKKE